MALVVGAAQELVVAEVRQVVAERLIPARHYRIENFLTRPERAFLLDFVQAQESAFVTSTIYPRDESLGREDRDSRRSRTLFEVDEVWPAFKSRLMPLLPHIRKEVDVGWFEVDDVERQLTVHGDGDFFSKHSDSGTESDRRAITFVYYFNCEPKAFEGGELRIYDSADRDGLVDAADSFTTIEPVDNSIVFFPSHFQHEVCPVRSLAPGLEGSRFTVNGWFRAVPHTLRTQEERGGVRLAPVEPAIDPRHLPTLQQKLLPTFTDVGFEVVDTPVEIHDLLSTEFERGRNTREKEEADPVYQLGGDPDFVGVESGAVVLDALQGLHEDWSGVELTPRAAYGFRIYRSGQSLRRHCDRLETHVISSIVHVAADVDEPWPLTIEDHAGRPHDVVLEPGQMLLYESASCPHARRLPLVGRYYTSLFLHYQPKQGWDWTLSKLYEAAADAGLPTRLPWYRKAGPMLRDRLVRRPRTAT